MPLRNTATGTTCGADVFSDRSAACHSLSTSRSSPPSAPSRATNHVRVDVWMYGYWLIARLRAAPWVQFRGGDSKDCFNSDFRLYRRVQRRFPCPPRIKPPFRRCRGWSELDPV